LINRTLAAEDDVFNARAIKPLNVDARLNAEGVTWDELRGVAFDDVRILMLFKADAVSSAMEALQLRSQRVPPDPPIHS